MKQFVAAWVVIIDIEVARLGIVCPCLFNIVILCYSPRQGRIYVANEYPTFARTKSMVGHELTFLRQSALNVRQNMPFLVKNMQILG